MEQREWRPAVKILLQGERNFYGPGCRRLLRHIDETGSVRLACERMGLSYSKAWKMLDGLELGLGYAVIVRKQGGKHGGETRLTPQGAEILERFCRFEAECVAAVAEIYTRHFPQPYNEKGGEET